jgi:hypothetical protein
MDESGISRRPNKGTRKEVVFSMNCAKAATFIEEREVTHISIVSIASLE